MLNTASAAILDQLQITKHTNSTGTLVVVNNNSVERRRPLDVIYIQGPILAKCAAVYQQRPRSALTNLPANQLSSVG